MLSQVGLKRILHYDPATGVFTWVSSPRRKWAGRVAGTTNADGYVYISIDGKRYLAHRLAFLYMTGFMPRTVDHIDGMSNAWVNLRPTDAAGNSVNARGRQAVSGAKGVYRQPGRRKYIALITVNGRSKWLGAFDTIEEAKNAYTRAQRARALEKFGAEDALKPEAY